MKNKILPILCIFILISCLFINNSFAYQDTYNDTTFYLPDEIIEISKGLEQYNEVGTTYDLIIFQDGFGGSDYYICFFPLGTSVYDSGRFTDGYKRELVASCGADSMSLIYYYSSFEYHGTMSKSGNIPLTYRIVDGQEYLYSTADIYTNSSCIDFFWTPPTPPTTLAGVLEEANPMKTFQTMMSGTIPYLIALVVGLVAFWKAWSILLKELRKA